MHAPLHRCLAVWLAATAAASGLLALLVPAAVAPATRFDEVLVRGCAITGMLAAGWLWTVTTAVAIEARRGHQRVPVPAAVRRMLLAACGVAVVAGLAAPAGAAPRSGPPETAARVVAEVLAGLPLPDRAHSRPSTPATTPPTTHATVRPGDTLWAIAEQRLGSGERWPELYALNRAVIGADPDLIRPAQRLRLPDPAEEIR